MRLLITGPPDCGKSAFAERLALQWPDVLYFATLPVTPATRGRIERHEERRPSHWRLVVATGDTAQDVAVLEASLYSESLLLLDGLTQYFTLVHFLRRRRALVTADALRTCADALADFVAERKRWIVVDVDAASRNAAPGSGIDGAAEAVHGRLKQRGLKLQLARQIPPTATSASAARPPSVSAAPAPAASPKRR